MADNPLDADAKRDLLQPLCVAGVVMRAWQLAAARRPAPAQRVRSGPRRRCSRQRPAHAPARAQAAALQEEAAELRAALAAAERRQREQAAAAERRAAQLQAELDAARRATAAPRPPARPAAAVRARGLLFLTPTSSVQRPAMHTACGCGSCPCCLVVLRRWALLRSEYVQAWRARTQTSDTSTGAVRQPTGHGSGASRALRRRPARRAWRSSSGRRPAATGTRPTVRRAMPTACNSGVRQCQLAGALRVVHMLRFGSTILNVWVAREWAATARRHAEHSGLLPRKAWLHHSPQGLMHPQLLGVDVASLMCGARHLWAGGGAYLGDARWEALRTLGAAAGWLVAPDEVQALFLVRQPSLCLGSQICQTLAQTCGKPARRTAGSPPAPGRATLHCRACHSASAAPVLSRAGPRRGGLRARTRGRRGARQVALGRVLGEGAFGVTRVGTWRGGDVAVKAVRVGAPSEATSFLREVAALAALRHPNIVGFYGAPPPARACGAPVSGLGVWVG